MLLRCGLIASHSEATTFLATEVGESGRCLSAGQRQLLCLARALFRMPRPKVVCLDEATASLDNACEEKIHVSPVELIFLAINGWMLRKVFQLK